MKLKTDLVEKTQESAELRASHAALAKELAEREIHLEKCREELAAVQHESARLSQQDIRSDDGVQDTERLEVESLRTTTERLESEIRALKSRIEEILEEKARIVQRHQEELKSALEACRIEVGGHHEQAIAEVIQMHAADKVAALAALELQFQSDASVKENAVREELRLAHEALIKSLVDDYARQLEGALQGLRSEIESANNEKERLLKDLTEKHSKEIHQLKADAAKDLENTIATLQAELKLTADKREAELRKELQLTHELALASAEKGFEQRLENAVAQVRREESERRTLDMDALARMKDAELKSALDAMEQKHRMESESLSVERDAALRKIQEVTNEMETRVTHAVATAEARKDEERVAALAGLKIQMQELLEAAVVEKEEYFKLYSKVTGSQTL